MHCLCLIVTLGSLMAFADGWQQIKPLVASCAVHVFCISVSCCSFHWIVSSRYKNILLEMLITALVVELVNRTEAQTGSESCYLVRAFFLGCWLTGLPTVPFFTDPFLARSLCFSEQPQDVRSSVKTSMNLNLMTVNDRFIWFCFLKKVTKCV